MFTYKLFFQIDMRVFPYINWINYHIDMDTS